MVGIIKKRTRKRIKPIALRRTKVTGKTTGEIGRIAREKNRVIIKRVRKRIKKIIRRG